MIHKKLRHWLPATLTGLLLTSAVYVEPAAYAQRVPTGTNQIAFADFDSATPGWDYGYFYSDGNIGGGYARQLQYSEPPYLTNNVYQYTFDSTVFAGFASWWGTGFGMPLPWVNDAAAFNSEDLADYILSFDARVEGLTPGQTTADCVMEFRLGVGANGDTWALVKALPYAPGSNWAHYVFTLADGSFIGADGQPTTSYQTFLDGLPGITSVRFNQNQPEPTEFGADADNFIYMDNIKLQVIQYSAPPPPPPPTVPYTIADWNMDDKPLWWTSGGWNWSQNSALPRGTYSYGTNAAGDAGAINNVGVGGSSGWVLWMTNSELAAPNTPGWAGIGMNGGGPIDARWFTSSNLADYAFTFDCRATGLGAGTTSAGAMAAVVFNAPDDTVEPADADTDGDRILRLNFNLPAGTNWQRVTYLLKDGSVDGEAGSSMARWQQYFNKITDVNAQWQINDANSESKWGFDDNNMIVMDNVRVERLVVGTPPLTVQQIADKVVVSWANPDTGSVKLLAGDTPTSVTTEIVGATSPYTNALSAAPKYYRTVWVPPPPRVFTRLQVLMPGETAAPGTPTGKTGTPLPQLMGTPFSVTVNAVDNNWYPVRGITDTIQVSTDDPSWGSPDNPMVSPDPVLANGRAMVMDLYLWSQGTYHIMVKDITDPTKTPDTGSPIVVQ